MTTATLPNSVVSTWSYAYRCDGLRDSVTSGGVTKGFTWDVNAGLPVILDDGSQYVYGAGLVAQVSGANTYYYLADGLGSTMATTDASGAVVNSYTYDVYGKTTASSGAQANDFQFAGQQTDPTGLQYLRARYYDPEVGGRSGCRAHLPTRSPARLRRRIPLASRVRSACVLMETAYPLAVTKPVSWLDLLPRPQTERKVQTCSDDSQVRTSRGNDHVHAARCCACACMGCITSGFGYNGHRTCPIHAGLHWMAQRHEKADQTACWTGSRCVHSSPRLPRLEHLG